MNGGIFHSCFSCVSARRSSPPLDISPSHHGGLRLAIAVGIGRIACGSRGALGRAAAAANNTTIAATAARTEGLARAGFPGFPFARPPSGKAATWSYSAWNGNRALARPLALAQAIREPIRPFCLLTPCIFRTGLARRPGQRASGKPTTLSATLCAGGGACRARSCARSQRVAISPLAPLARSLALHGAGSS